MLLNEKVQAGNTIKFWAKCVRRGGRLLLQLHSPGSGDWCMGLMKVGNPNPALARMPRLISEEDKVVCLSTAEQPPPLRLCLHFLHLLLFPPQQRLQWHITTWKRILNGSRKRVPEWEKHGLAHGRQIKRGRAKPHASQETRK